MLAGAACRPAAAPEATPVPPEPAKPEPAPQTAPAGLEVGGDLAHHEGVSCWRLPGAARLGLRYEPATGTLIYLRRWAAESPGTPHPFSLTRLDPKTGEPEELADAMWNSNSTPTPTRHGEVLFLQQRRAPRTGRKTRRVQDTRIRLPALVVLTTAGEQRVLSTPGHDVTSFVWSEELGTAFYAAGRSLWRVDLDGGEATEVAKEVMEVYDVAEDGLLAEVAGSNRLTVARLALDGSERSALEMSGVGATYAGDRIYIHGGGARLGWAPRAEGKAEPVKLEGLGNHRLLRVGNQAALSLPPTRGGPAALLRLDGPARATWVEVEGAVVTAADRTEDRMALLLAHNTDGIPRIFTYDEADVCITEPLRTADAEMSFSVPPRSMPVRIFLRQPQIEAIVTQLGLEMKSMAVLRSGRELRFSVGGRGPATASELHRLAEATRAGLAEVLEERQVGVRLDFMDSGRFVTVTQVDGQVLHRHGFTDLVTVADPADYPLHVTKLARTKAKNAADDAPVRCSGKVENHIDAALELEAQCVPPPNSMMGFGGGIPKALRGTVSPSPLTEGTEGSFEMDGWTSSLRSPVEFTTPAGDVVPALVVAENRDAEQLHAWLNTLAERHGARLGTMTYGPLVALGTFGGVGPGPDDTRLLDERPGTLPETVQFNLPADLSEADRRALARDAAKALRKRWPSGRKHTVRVYLLAGEEQLVLSGSRWTPVK